MMLIFHLNHKKNYIYAGNKTKSNPVIMRKETFKMVKSEPRVLEHVFPIGKLSYSSMNEFNNIQSSQTVDDEEYFFEVEDY